MAVRRLVPALMPGVAFNKAWASWIKSFFIAEVS
jgi:hypothetical protein